jgi:hypothetical protein
MPSHTQYPVLAGKPDLAHWAPVIDTAGLWDTNRDVQQGGVNDPRRQIILDELDAAIAARQFSAIILDDNPKELEAFWAGRLEPYYRLEGQLFAEPDVFWTVSGAPTRPQLIYVPR